MAWAQSKIAFLRSGLMLSGAVVAQSGRCALRVIYAVSRGALLLLLFRTDQHSLGTISTTALEAFYQPLFWICGDYAFRLKELPEVSHPRRALVKQQSTIKLKTWRL